MIERREREREREREMIYRERMGDIKMRRECVRNKMVKWRRVRKREKKRINERNKEKKKERNNYK